jgi:hypothetical protein
MSVSLDKTSREDAPACRAAPLAMTKFFTELKTFVLPNKFQLTDG